MTRSSLVRAIAFTTLLGASSAQAQTSDPLLRLKELEDPRLAPAVVRELGALSPQKVVGPLLLALERSPGLRAAATRYRAYELLAVLVEERGSEAVIRHDAQVRGLVGGLGEPVAGIRIVCARALGLVEGEHRATAVDELTLALSDRDPMVVATAAGSLARFGPAASPALPRLRDLLVDGLAPSPPEPGEVDPGPELLVALDHRLRANLAAARIRIRGGLDAEELALLRGLAPRDQGGPALAVSGWLAALEPARMSAEPALAEAIRFVAEHAGDSVQPSRSRLDMVRALGRVLSFASALPDADRSAAIEAFLVGSMDEHDELRELSIHLLETHG